MSSRGKDGMTTYERKIADRLPEIAAWNRDGFNTYEIAEKLGVSERTLITCCSHHEDLKECFRVTREIVDRIEMIPAAMRRARGYDATETQYEYKYIHHRDGSVEEILVGKKVFQKHIPGDPRLLEFWLKNRLRKEFGNLEEINGTVNTGGVVLLPDTAAVIPEETKEETRTE